MERDNSVFFKVKNPTASKDFPMTGNNHHHLFAAGNLLQAPDTALFEAENHFHGAAGEIIPYGGPNYPYNLSGFPLESEFNRMSISALPPPPNFMAAPPPSYGGAAASIAGSNIWNNSSVDIPNNGIGFSDYNQSSFTNGDIHRMRVQSAARAQNMGLYLQLGNYQGLGNNNIENLYLRSVNRSMDGMISLNGLQGNVINNPRRSLNGAAVDYQPRANRNGFRNSHYDQMVFANQLNLNRNNNASFEYRNGIDQPNNSSASSVPLMNIPDLQINGNDNNGSPFRSRNRASFSSLKDLRGKIFLVAKDQYGCRFLQNKFEEGKPEEIQMIFSELKDHICDLMVDQFGNYLMQKFFEVCNEEQTTQLLCVVIADEIKFKEICADMHGTRAAQKLIEHLKEPHQKSLVVSALRSITNDLTKSPNGHHVIEHCLKLFSCEDNTQILNVVADNCLSIATDKSGCCVLQQCVEKAAGEPLQRLLAEITSNALILSENPYGNYVVQYILGLRIPHVTAEIMAQLSGNFVSLSMNKYGSNVVEKCLKESGGDQTFLQIISEMIRDESRFLRVLQDPYGNYVAQSAISISRGALKNALINRILYHYAYLHSHPHGKRVLARTRGNRQHRA